MTNIMFIGSRVNGYFAEELCRKDNYQYHQIEPDADIELITSKILEYVCGGNKTKIQYIIFDVDGFINEANIIAEEIAKIARAIHAQPIVYMPFCQPGSVMAQAMIAQDIKSYIFSGSSETPKEQLLKYISGYFDVNEREIVIDMDRVHQEAEAQKASFSTIGIAGTQERIGTTTQAIQIVRYLQAKGHKACYIELNQQKYFDLSHKNGSFRQLSFVEKYKAWTGATREKVCYEGVDMYVGHDSLIAARNEGYDYYVYDYGSITERDFDRMAFLKDNLQIVVGGGKPTEFDFLQQFLIIPQFADSKLILSFVPEEDQNAVLKTMSEISIVGRKDNIRQVIFAEYIPDPFAIPDLNNFEKLIPVDYTEEMEQALEAAKGKNKKRKLFGRKEK